MFAYAKKPFLSWLQNVDKALGRNIYANDLLEWEYLLALLVGMCLCQLDCPLSERSPLLSLHLNSGNQEKETMVTTIRKSR